ncbi:MAG: hypothetical protein ABI780_14095 [Ardenticatenales bacterium]
MSAWRRRLIARHHGHRQPPPTLRAPEPRGRREEAAGQFAGQELALDLLEIKIGHEAAEDQRAPRVGGGEVELLRDVRR